MKQPEYAMCMVCGDVLYAGPGMNPIPRECECKATIVIPTEERGFVRWSEELYEANAQKLMQDTLRSCMEAGLPEDECKLKAKKAYDSAAREPEVEYTERFLDPSATRVAVPDITIDQAVAHHMGKLYEKGEV